MKKRWIRVITASAIAILISGVIWFNSTARVFAQAWANVVVDLLKNSETDFVDPVELEAQDRGVTLDLESVAREWNEIKIHYTLTFDEDISVFKTMGLDVGYKTRSVFYEEAFNDCKININGATLYGGTKSFDQNVYEMTDIFFCYDVNDISITEHTLEQEIVLYLNDPEFNEDLNITLDYDNIKVGDKTSENSMYINYTLKGGKYSGAIDADELDLKTTSSNGTQFNITGYACTNTGLKVFADCIMGENEDVTITFLIAKDNLGNQYLYYPKYDGDKMTFSIYDGEADEKDEYLNYLNPGADTLTLALYEEASDKDAGICGTKEWEEFYVDYWEHYYENAIQLSSEFTVNLTTGECSINE
jgi:hypothetical protein